MAHPLASLKRRNALISIRRFGLPAQLGASLGSLREVTVVLVLNDTQVELPRRDQRNTPFALHSGTEAHAWVTNEALGEDDRDGYLVVNGVTYTICDVLDNGQGLSQLLLREEP